MRKQRFYSSFLISIQTRFFYLLRSLMNLWVRSELFGVEHIRDIDSENIKYVFRSRSLTDVLVYDGHAQEAGLAGPLKKNFVLGPKGMFRLRSERRIPKTLKDILKQVDSGHDDVFLVPISVFWGRDPGPEEKSLFHLLFFDDEYGGWLQRLIMFFVQGQRVSCHIGHPLSVKQALSDESHSRVETGKKLRRLLRVQYHKQRTVALGPQLYDRQQLIREVVTTSHVQDFIESEGKTQSQRRKLQEESNRYVEEIAAKPSHSIIRFCSILLDKIWTRMYDNVMIRGLQELRPYSEKHTLIFMPCHRSHVDYLMLGQMIYHSGLTPPHCAAGKNMDFWPIGGLLRRAGAFYIRRSFAGKKLYTIVFRQYLSYLIRKGFPVMFFPEGGRSRTGKLLQPKTGMLSMVLQSAKEANRTLALVPVYINYDRLFEGPSFVAERRGKSKKVESFGQLFHAAKVIGARAGHAYFNYGSPLILEHESEYQPEDVKKIAQQMMLKINKAAMITPVAHVATILLASGGDALEESHLVSLIHKSSQILNDVHGECVQSGQLSPEEVLQVATTFGGIKKFSHPAGAVVYAESQDAEILQYYRNNTLHLYALPSLIASFFMHNDKLNLKDLCISVNTVARIIGEEIFLDFDEETVVIALEAMIRQGLLLKDDDGIKRPYVLSAEFTDLSVFAGFLGGEIESFSHVCVFLAEKFKDNILDTPEFERDCLKVLHRQSLLSGSREFVELKLLQNLLQTLQLAGAIEVDLEEEKLRV